MATETKPLDRTLARGIAWVGGMKWLTQAVSWAITLVVARLLTPADYGIVGMATVYLGLAQLVGDAGLTTVIIQAPSLSSELAARIGGLGAMVGVALCAMSLGAAGGVAWFFGEPAVRWVVTAMSANFLIRGLQVLPRGLLARELRFRELAWIDAAESLTVALTTLAGAALGLRYWALVCGALAGSLASTAVCVTIRWHPIRNPGRWRDLTEAMVLGGQVISSQIAWYTYSNADFAIVGRVLGKAALGAYTFGWSIASLPVDRLTSLVGRVAPPVFAAVQRDRSELRRHLCNLTEGLALVTMPLCVGLALVAPELVRVVLGDAWIGAVAPLRLLALYAAFRCIVALLPTVLVYTGHAKRNMQYAVAALIVLPATFLVGTRWGTVGVAYGWITVYPVFIAVTYVRYTLAVLDLPWRRYLRSVWPAASGTAVMAGAVVALQARLPTALAPTLRLVALVSTGAFVYLVIVSMFHGRRMLVAVRLLRREPDQEPRAFYRSEAGEPRRRLLLASYHFPPSAAVGGLRWQKMARDACERGWGLDVITADPSACESLDVRRLGDLPQDVRLYTVPDPPSLADRAVNAAWRLVRPVLRRRAPRSRARPSALPVGDSVRRRERREIVRAYFAWTRIRREEAWGRRAGRIVEDLLRASGHDALISSGPPHFSHAPLAQVAARYRVPFIVDLRDPWSLTRQLPESIASPLWTARAIVGERRLIHVAALVVANTEVCRDALRALYPGAASRIIAVTNGYDDEAAPPMRAARKFTIAYAGTIYLDRDPRPLLKAVARVIHTRGLSPSEFSVEFMGAAGEFNGVPLPRLATECGVVEFVHLHAPRPRHEALEFLSRAAMLVVLPQSEEFSMPAKVFEYARFAAWVLALAEPASATARALAPTDADVVHPFDTTSIAATIDRRYEQFTLGERARPLSRFAHLSRRAQARLLFDAIESLVGSPGKMKAADRLENERAGIGRASYLPAIAVGPMGEQ